MARLPAGLGVVALGLGLLALLGDRAAASKYIDGACYNDQIAGLKVLYSLTGGVNWRNKWDLGTDPCLNHWYGIECDSDGNVLKIGLGGNNLKGYIPESFARFPKLRELDLANNYLTQPLPESLKTLTTLRVFKIAQNQFTGDMDADFFDNMPLLREVDISDNNFDGALSQEIFDVLRGLGGKFDFSYSQESSIAP
eukprot:CAMPEP_0118850338 /NCGR_PEP_ID=MMETSP1163-20130328/240_1 /TAXON_ID=124430 /ORGANISM="Phaeomonas parva, Strain CCMP2877" /LENGTH=195 /DNA_ID=CAMNT_0006782543 /DNA_START=92 /DNA_END=679 /DNA_ORIENTATION=-